MESGEVVDAERRVRYSSFDGRLRASGDNVSEREGSKEMANGQATVDITHVGCSTCGAEIGSQKHFDLCVQPTTQRGPWTGQEKREAAPQRIVMGTIINVPDSPPVRSFDRFIELVRDSVEAQAAKKGYSDGGADGPNQLLAITQIMGINRQHAIAEIVYKCVEFLKNPREVLLIKISGWSFILWRSFEETK